MARRYFAVALAAAVCAFVLLAQVLSQTGFSNFGLWERKYNYFGGSLTGNIEVKQADGEPAAGGTYLVGVGKADITG